jgi:hypothetical protein
LKFIHDFLSLGFGLWRELRASCNLSR